MMKTKTLFLLAICLLLVTPLLSACQVRIGGPASAKPGAAAAQGAAQVAQVETPTAMPVEPTLPPRPTATAKPLPSATPAAEMQAEQAAREYFSLLEKGEFEQASENVSTFSLMVFNMTHGDAASALQSQKINGARWSKLEVGESKRFDPHTILVHVKYTLQTKSDAASGGAVTDVAKDELWPMRSENNAWRYNWNNLIDYRTLNMDAQTTSGVTVMPVQTLRFTDCIRLVMLVQNRTTQPVVFGQVNEILATFHFGDQDVVAEKAQIILNPLRSVPDVKLEIKGLFDSYPDSVEIRKWKTYNVKPWYVFQLQ